MLTRYGRGGGGTNESLSASSSSANDPPGREPAQVAKTLNPLRTAHVARIDRPDICDRDGTIVCPIENPTGKSWQKVTHQLTYLQHGERRHNAVQGNDGGCRLGRGT